jgi:hypothetical protein
MTAVTDATLIIETVIGRPLTGPQLSSIADKVVALDPFGYLTGGPGGEPSTYFADPENPTNEEKAQLFLDTTERIWRNWMQRGGAEIAKETTDATVAAAMAAAEAELD